MELSGIFWIVSSVIVLGAIVFFARGLLISKKSNAQDSANNSQKGEEAKVTNSWRDKLSSINLSVQEKIELSWEFLYKITDVVLKKFSSQDKKELQEAAKTLVENGMTYQHVVDYGITKEVYLSRSKQQQSQQKR